MKKTLLIAALAAFSFSAFAQTVFSPTGDTWVRSDNAGAKNGTSTTFEIKNDQTNGNYFYGLLSFTIDAPATGQVVKSAVLRLTTRVERGNRNVGVYASGITVDEANTNYTAVSEQLATALANEPVATFNMEGDANRAITDNGLAEKYQVISIWQHNIDLTDYVKGLNSTAVNLLIAKTANTGANSSAFFTKEAADLTWNAGLSNTDVAGTTISKNDLFPQLTVTYGTATGISNVKTETVAGGETYNLAGQRVDAPTKGLYIVNGKKIVMK